MNLEERIQAGLRGDYKGLSNGFNRINKYVFGIQKKTYYLFGGQSGVYKSTLVNFMLFNAIQDAESKGIPINVFYYSFEIDKLTMQCNFLSTNIYQKYGIVIPPEKIKGLGDFRLNEKEQELVKAEIPIVEALFDKINFSFKAENPTGIYHTLYKFSEENGTIEYEEYSTDEGIKKRFKSYTPNNPSTYNIVVLDHLYLLKKERGFQTKEVIDKMSEFAVLLRNLFGYTIIFIQQFNQGLSSVERLKFKGADLSPQQSDFRDSTSPYADADVVFGNMSPFKLDINSCLGYNIEKLEDKMIMLKIIKNRLSTDNLGFGLHVNPKAGVFVELPLPHEIKYDDYK